MTNQDVLDQKALASARQYMGLVAWPTVVLGLVVGVSYVATVALTLTGFLSLWLAAPVVAALTYLSYTVAHDSVHGSISGTHPSLRWINKSLGYLAAWILMIPLTAHRYEHMAHHRHANDSDNDPDFPVEQMQNSLPAAARAAFVFGVERIGMLVAAAANDHLAVGQNRGGVEDVDRMMIGKARLAGVDLPQLLAREAVERVERAARVAEVDRPVGHQRRGHDPVQGVDRVEAAGPERRRA